MRYFAAGAGFRRAERSAGSFQKGSYGIFQGIIRVGVYVVPDYCPEGLQFPVYALFLLLFFAAVNGEAESYACEGGRKIGQMHI